MLRIRHPQRLDGKLALAGDVQGSPAADHDLEARASLEELHDERRGGEDLLEVIQNQQELLVVDVFGDPLLDRSAARLLERERLRDRRGDQARICDWGKRNEVDPALEVV